MLIDISQYIEEAMEVWPGDEAVQFRTTMSISEGEAVNVSAVTMSTHTGTHMDAPFHYDQDGITIEDVPLDACIGTCRVIEMYGEDTITAAHLESHKPFSETRLLIRTSDHGHGYEQFPVLTAEAVHLLAEEGIRLIGIDGPSIDPLESKVLPAHHACRENRIIILEGLRFREARAGTYDLAAQPLALKGRDGAPVRAVLRPVTV
ncbi:cyclase family protein [Alkalicoccus chagannorensis]|uniref:cyclase family protein n=1 Tax=Alkalicoccus chagannorensis TaxID=427072 RepID=UPI0003FE5BAD|nr:cyclase family protein [Alkalicoccus chagannorensis]